jgi:hypothetical protein
MGRYLAGNVTWAAGKVNQMREFLALGRAAVAKLDNTMYASCSVKAVMMFDAIATLEVACVSLFTARALRCTCPVTPCRTQMTWLPSSPFWAPTPCLSSC